MATQGGDASVGSDVRFVIVSNRGPVTFSLSESCEREYSRGAGGLVTALSAVSRRRRDAVWIASAMSEEDARVAEESLEEPYEVEGFKLVLVEHEAEAYDLMYNRLANPLLWFVQHGLYNLPYAPELGEGTKRAWEEGYVAVNKNFAGAVARALEDGGGEEPGWTSRRTSCAALRPTDACSSATRRCLERSPSWPSFSPPARTSLSTR